MPTTLGRKYDTLWRGSPPHMLDSDIPVWYRFLEKWGDIFIALYYDVLLGGPSLTRAQEGDSMWKMWRANVSKRADAIAELEKELWIIEVAKRPGLRAIGQLMTYMALWREDPKIEKIEIPVLVCEEVDTDLIASAAQYGMRVYVTPLT